MILDSATVETNYQRFLTRIIENEVVYYLSNEEGVANSLSNEDESICVLLFWSDRAYAVRANKVFNEEYVEAEMSLFDFLYRWLPGMTSDGVLAGPNWNGDLVGRESDAFDLRDEIERRMPGDMSNAYEERYHELTGRT